LYSLALYLLTPLYRPRLAWHSVCCRDVAGRYNPREAAAAGMPGLTGLYTWNVSAVVELPADAGVGWRVHDATEIPAWVLEQLQDPGLRTAIAPRATDVVYRHRGAAEGEMQDLAPCLSAGNGTRRGADDLPARLRSDTINSP
jgi:hypothetical protein